MSVPAPGTGAAAGPAAERAWADAAEHVEVYRRTAGAEGHRWHGRPHLLLGTTGRRSGRLRTVPLVYARARTAAGERLVVVASAGGAERHPAWYLNLVAAPAVQVQLLDRVWSTAATTAAGQDEEAGWAAMAATWDGFARYRALTARRIPVVLLGPPPTDLPDPGEQAPDALP
ncbi:nitroreductase/quinone reductase family protein [Aquipuribacter hungaricus]|uniref:Nitroreductase/quinone reductase family protein n=1 Tax=Aquipuribacter hungaricus TaxID=545624 RepID=A0ABV7WDC4_9MICO